MKLWPWSTIARLEMQVSEQSKTISALRFGNQHYARVFESLPADQIFSAQKKISEQYLREAREQMNSKSF